MAGGRTGLVTREGREDCRAGLGAGQAGGMGGMGQGRTGSRAGQEGGGRAEQERGRVGG